MFGVSDGDVKLRLMSTGVVFGRINSQREEKFTSPRNRVGSTLNLEHRGLHLHDGDVSPGCYDPCSWQQILFHREEQVARLWCYNTFPRLQVLDFAHP